MSNKNWYIIIFYIIRILFQSIGNIKMWNKIILIFIGIIIGVSSLWILNNYKSSPKNYNQKERVKTNTKEGKQKPQINLRHSKQGNASKPKPVSKK